MMREVMKDRHDAASSAVVKRKLGCAVAGLTVALLLLTAGSAAWGQVVVPIANPGFEEFYTLGQPTYGGDGKYDYLPPWSDVSYTTPNWEYYLQDYTTYWNPTAAMITGEAPEGQCVGGVEADTRADPGPVTGGLRQVLSTELAPDTAYTLTVKVGNPNFMDYPAKTNKWPGYRVQLLAAETVLAEDANTVAVPRNTWITSSVNYTSGPTVTPGQSLEIRLVNMALVTGGSGTDLYVLYDDVHLTATSASTPPTIISYGPLSGSSFPLVFSGRNGQSYEVLSSTNVALPMSLWTTQSSGLFGVGGPTLTNYTDTSATNRAQFYRIRSP